MQRSTISLIFIVFFSLNCNPCRADRIDSLLLFGDSYFDTGAGNEVAITDSLPLPSPTPPYFGGRHSDGPIWVDYLGDYLHLPNTNFAVSGAETGSSNNFVPGLGGLSQQLSRYTSSHDSIKSDTLTLIDGGGNDLMGVLTMGIPSEEDFQAKIPQSIENMSTVISQLQELGAEKIIVWNLGNVSILPLFTNPFFGLESLAPLFQDATVNYNNALLELVQQLNADSEGDQQIFLFDAFTVFNDLAQQYVAMGGDLTQFSFNEITLSPTGVQPEYLAFYDEVHPTTFLWKAFANSITAFVDTLINGPRFIAAQRNLVFENSRAYQDLLDNHYRTLHLDQLLDINNCDDCCYAPSPLQFYVDGEFKNGSTHTRGGTYGINYNTRIGVAGIDYRFNENLLIGSSFTYQSSGARVREHSGSMELKNYIPTLYTVISACDLFVDADISYQYHDFNRISRNIIYLSETAKGHTKGWSVDTGIEVGYMYNEGCFSAIPLLGLRYQNLHIDSYKEKGTSAYDLKVDDQHDNSLIGKIGGQFFLNNLCICEYALTPFFEASLEHEFLRHKKRMSLRLYESNDGSIVYHHTGEPDLDVVKYALGIDARFSPVVSANISYLGETTFRSYNNAIRAEIDIRF